MASAPTPNAAIGSFALFSRDERTHKLFRASWLAAIKSVGGTSVSKCRGFGIVALVRYVHGFWQLRHTSRLVFGTSEVLLTIAFGKASDILVFTGLGRLLQAGGKMSKLVRILLRLGYRGQAVISLNVDDQRYLSTLFSTEVSLINGEGYGFSEQPLSIRPSVPLRLGYVGRLLRSKAVDQLICIAGQLEGCRLTLIGDVDFGNSDGVDPNWIQEQVYSSGGRIRHLGFVDDVKAALQDIDVVVSMSVREGLPFSVLDAIDSGCLAILSPVPGHMSFEGIEGVLFTEANSLAALLQNVIATPSEYFQYDPQRRKLACHARFGFDEITRSIREVLVERTRLSSTVGVSCE